MKAVFADTSYYIALLSKRDEHHRVAVDYTASLDGTFVTTAWVLTELANFLSRRANRTLFVSLLRDLQNDDRVEIIPPGPLLFDRGIALYESRGDKDWSLTDCISFVAMGQRGVTDALTVDRHFEQAGFNRVL